MKNKIILIPIIIFIAILLILLISNLTKPTSEALKSITYQQIKEKIENEEDFILIVSQSTCSHCATYKPKVKQIAQKHNITTYYIDFDKEKDKEEFLTEFNLSGATPMTLFFKEGKEQSILNRIEGDISATLIEKKFKEMGFIK